MKVARQIYGGMGLSFLVNMKEYVKHVHGNSNRAYIAYSLYEVFVHLVVSSNRYFQEYIHVLEGNASDSYYDYRVLDSRNWLRALSVLD